MTLREKHDAFVEELKKGLYARPFNGSQDDLRAIQEQLEQTFDELFGSIDDDDPDDEA